MNPRSASAGALVIGTGLVAGLTVIFMILLDPGNQVGQFFKFLLAVLFALGLVFPRPGIYVLVAACGYFDVLKRLLVVADRVSFNDLTFVLGCPPALLGGVVLGLLVQWANGKRKMQSWNWMCFALVPVISAVVFFGNMLGGTTVKNAAAECVNGGFYAALLVIVPLLFPTADELRKLLRFVMWVYLPVALYGVWQHFFGLSDFEIIYLKTGLTILIDNLVMGELKPFSTLNSPTALGAVCSLLAVICFMDQWHTPKNQRSWGQRIIKIFLGVIYVAGWIASTSRIDGVVLILAPLAAFLFMGRIHTNALYFALTCAFVTLVLMSDYILESVERLQYFLWSFTGTSDSQFFDQMTRLGTYSDRLMGFSAWTHDPRMWTLFGAPQMVKDTVHFHDPLTLLLLDFGVVPMLVGLGLGMAVLTRIHRRIWRIESESDRRLACTGLAMAMALVVASVLGGDRLSVFPVGAFFWLVVSVSVSRAWEVKRVAETEEVPETVMAPSVDRPRHRAGRFQPVRQATSAKTT